jgi:DNA-binding NarL/FixJ family response regulator
VLIADDDDLMRAGLIELLSGDPSIQIAGEAATGRKPSNERAGSTPTSCSWTSACRIWTGSRRRGS